MSLLRRLEGQVVRECGTWSRVIWNRCWHGAAGDERGAARRLHFRLPLHAASHGWTAGPALGISHLSESLRLFQLPQSPPHAVGMDEPGVGDVLGYLHSHVLD